MIMEKYKPLISAIHALPGLVSIKVCGSGSGITSLLSSVAGCSKTLLHSETLYNAYASEEVLDYIPRQFVSSAIAHQLAQSAYRDGLHLWGKTKAADTSSHGSTEQNPSIIGIGITSALTTDRVRKGDCQVFLTTWISQKGGKDSVVLDYHLTLPKEWEREEQEEEVLRFALYCVADVFAYFHSENSLPGLSQFVPDSCKKSEFHLPTLTCVWERRVTSLTMDPQLPIELLRDGKVSMLLWNRHGDLRVAHEPFHPELEKDDTPRVNLLYPGSFNPLHYGHTELARAACKVAAQHFSQEARITYEIGLHIMDKGEVAEAELRDRLQPFFSRGKRVAITRAALFIEKAQLFPGYGFVIGLDTAKRVLNPKYYDGGTEEGMVSALLLLKETGNFFIVAGRKSSASAVVEEVRQGGSWEGVSSLSIPVQLKDLFLSIPESEFRVDVSSTEIRERRKRNE